VTSQKNSRRGIALIFDPVQANDLLFIKLHLNHFFEENVFCCARSSAEQRESLSLLLNSRGRGASRRASIGAIWWDVKKDARCEVLNEARVLKHVSTQATGR